MNCLRRDRGSRLVVLAAAIAVLIHGPRRRPDAGAGALTSRAAPASNADQRPQDLHELRLLAIHGFGAGGRGSRLAPNAWPYPAFAATSPRAESTDARLLEQGPQGFRDRRHLRVPDDDTRAADAEGDSFAQYQITWRFRAATRCGLDGSADRSENSSRGCWKWCDSHRERLKRVSLRSTINVRLRAVGTDVGV